MSTENLVSKTYQPQEVENKWYLYWLEQKFFKSIPDSRKPYTIVIPPPNVTGVLHMGHMLNNTIQDVLIRRKRMEGFNACWVPGTDHASIATEAKVVNLLREKGIHKNEITREGFLKHAWEWKEKYGGIILKQLRYLGCSCDWDRTRFTMEPKLSDAVTDVFIDLYKKGLIYRGLRMINWDPQGLTALSNEEVIYREVQGKLYFVRYALEDSQGKYITVATTRPETILGDVAIAVHPQDERYQHLAGKYAFVPLINRRIPIIQDTYIDPEFGTGCLKVTPAHDINDYEIGLKHQLKVIDILNPDGTLNESAQLFVGKDRFEARELIVDSLQEHNLLEKIQEIEHSVGFSERTNAVVEPRLSLQWFLKMQNLATPALQVALQETVKFIPEKFINTYQHWMENVKDWCISRQLWWGHRIPVFYLPDNSYIVAKTPKEALTQANIQRQKEHLPEYTEQDITQDPDVLDTWFSSWLWPISVFDGFENPQNPDFQYYYPTQDLVTAPEILFFWVARMIMAGIEYTHKPPFENVYLTGIVRDKIGRKMSKQLGNSPDPLELITQYSADGVRVGMLLCSPAGNDLLFDESLCEQGRNFANKLWNAYRLIASWNPQDNALQLLHESIAIQWIQQKIAYAADELSQQFGKFRISDALMTLYRLIWNDFCAWFLEFVKPAFGQPIHPKTHQAVLEAFDAILRLLHPFMPFITEEIWQEIKPRQKGQSIMISSVPQPILHDDHERLFAAINLTQELISAIRQFRVTHNLAQKQVLPVLIKTSQSEIFAQYGSLAQKLAHIESIKLIENSLENIRPIILQANEVFIPIQNTTENEQAAKEKNDAEIKHLENFLQSIESKLSNEKFLANAKPEVIEREIQKKQDTLEKLAVLRKSIS
ncbi:MAG: valine--tRNA ligase [Bacteroidia bacterium]|nr:valine--tRNA ligase [Bacteroidia bacterium]